VNRFFKGIAIAALIATIAGAGAVLYGLTMLAPQVESVSVVVTPAAQVPDVFKDTMSKVQSDTFAGTQFADANGLSAEDASFITYTMRLANRGFFPAEWITLLVEPHGADGTGYDVSQLPDERAQVLPAFAEGDVSATILRAGDASQTARNMRIVCYVFGQKVEVAAQAN
jgi:hypothetical protein